MASAIVKLWEKCEIAKIAVKKGVQNTNSEMMAEELKVSIVWKFYLFIEIFFFHLVSVFAPKSMVLYHALFQMCFQAHECSDIDFSSIWKKNHCISSLSYVD